MCVLPFHPVSVFVLFFMLLSTTDDDFTTQRKVNLLLERINKLKWRTSGNVEEEEKVSVRMRRLPASLSV